MTMTSRSCAPHLLLALALSLPAAAAHEPSASKTTTAATAKATAPKQVHKRAAPVPMGVGLLDVTVAPWGEIVVDGKTRAKSATRTRLYLPVGVHDIEVKNPWSRSEQRRVEVTHAGAQLRVRLRPRPASLVVHSNVDADVLIDGVSVGRSWTSEIAPLAVPLDGWRARRAVRITLQRPGFKPLVTEATLVAGTRTVIGARLVETQGDTGRGGGIAHAKPFGAPLSSR